MVEEETRWIAGSTIVRKLEDIYDLKQIINHGEFADVYKCRLKNRQTIKAVKRIPKRGDRKNPIKNATLVLQLDHPNLVVIREVLECPSYIYIVQDYVNGGNLFEKISKTKVHTEHDVSKYCFQILTGLQYMHDYNIYHGKLHGENVLIRDDNNEQTLCLVDYAYSSLCASHAKTLLVNSTPSFCAPEILRGEPFSASSDVWQLGLLAFYCLSGTWPFHGTNKKIFQNILNGNISYDSKEWDYVSANGRSFVAHLLKLNTRDRFTICQSFSHPWIREKIYRSENLSQAQANITANQREKKSKNQV